ncbi:MAG: L-threonylcarbamoyladenylate synthase [Candidatus Nanoarchaeia archaeon]|jgi:L-threonylcarbamoyladenylate synthase|nr:L-threonylcarbamoyladenylate synthase [Candidatus Nanoarchaeia archaeon]|tara:strand:+ start:720 stop:1256 length:537 start_codon:yes stop_codon:yes gene_type:complete
MKRISLTEVKDLSGKIFIYPTDTIYGLGCDATNSKLVRKIRELKKRENKPFSVIAPSKKWIYDNFSLPGEAREWVKKLPGPYTLVLKMKKKCVSDSVAKEKIGVRIPENEFTKIVKSFGKPFVTTSVNISGEPSLKNPNKLKASIAKGVNYLVDVGTIKGKASTVVDLSSGKAIILRK